MIDFFTFEWYNTKCPAGDFSENRFRMGLLLQHLLLEQDLREVVRMILYHMSQTLILGEEMKNDYEKKLELTLPYVYALEKGIDSFCDMLVNGQSQQTVPYETLACEGVFEFIRKTEFPNCISRLKCKYFFDNLENFRILYEAGWKQEPEEERAKIHLYEIELDDEYPQKCDMLFYDEAVDAFVEKQDVETVLSCARRYFSGQQSKSPVWEIMSDKPAKPVKDISNILRSMVE